MFLCHFFVPMQLRKPQSTQSIPSMKSGNRDNNNKDVAGNEEAGVALVNVHSEYPRYVNIKFRSSSHNANKRGGIGLRFVTLRYSFLIRT